MTELLHAEFEDETGTTRRLTRDEVLTFVNVLAGAGNETTNAPDRLDRQGARRASRPAPRARGGPVADPRTRSRRSCATSRPRHTSRGTWRATSSTTGRTVPAGSAMMFLVGVGQPRRPALSRWRPLRHPPEDRPPPQLRLRHPLLPGRRAGPPRRARRARRGARSASPSGRSTGTTPGWLRPPRFGVGRRFPSSPALPGPGARDVDHDLPDRRGRRRRSAARRPRRRASNAAPMWGRTRPRGEQLQQLGVVACSSSGAFAAKSRIWKPRTCTPLSSTRLSGMRGITPDA